MHDTQSTVTVLITLLLIASAVAMVTKWVRVPYTVALVIVGLIVSPMHYLPAVHISPELILLIFLPALLFEAAWNLDLRELRAALVPMLVLAVPGVLIVVVLVAVVLHAGAGLSWRAALLFGAMVSATDPVSVVALFREMHLPKRLLTLVEGESLFNDGTAVVVFRIVLGFAVGTATLDTGAVAWRAGWEFVIVVLGGIVIGGAVGFMAAQLTSYFDDHLLEITLTTIAAYGSFLLAEALRVSPVIAVLLAGLVIGNYGRGNAMSAGTQVAVQSFWEYAAFAVNSLTFLLIGLDVSFTVLTRNAGAIAWAIGAVLLSRLVTVYPLVAITNRCSEIVPLAWRHVLFWGGLRGALSIALALSLPAAIAAREELTAMVFGVVIFSLLAQGLSMASLLKRWRIGRGTPLTD